MTSLILLNSDALHIPLADKSVQCVVTSPPFYGLRDYGTAKWDGGRIDCNHQVGRFEYPASDKQKSNSGSAGHQAKDICPKCGAIRVDNQIGLEETPEEYVGKLVKVFREVKRVLRDDGVIWVNMGDSYNGSGGAGGDYNEGGLKEGQPKYPGRNIDSLKPKDLIGIPWRLAFALQADGWYLRSDVIWNKLNPMPEPVQDRPTKSHEYIFLLSKSAQYYYNVDAVRENFADDRMGNPGVYQWSYANNEDSTGVRGNGGYLGNLQQGKGWKKGAELGGRNRRTVWTIPIAPYKGAHFATYPPALVEPCIKAGTSERGCCSVCGAPWDRVIETDYHKHRPSGGKTSRIERGNRVHDGGFGNWGTFGTNLIKDVTTTGWKPVCEHYPRVDEWCEYITPKTGEELTQIEIEENESIRILRAELMELWSPMKTVPCVVFDPFVGSGTTLLVARQLKRNSIGCDLSYSYLHDQARTRLQLDKLAKWIGK